MSRPAAPPARSAHDEASSWLARLDRGLREEEGLALRGWVKEAGNRDALAAAARLWHGQDAMAVLSRLFPISPEAAKPKPRRRLFKIGVMSAAAVCIVACGAALLNGQRPWAYFDGSLLPPPAFTRAVYTTALGERRQVMLGDGSTMTLNTGTRIAVDYSLHLRAANLLYGEVSFDVAPDTQRPFNVHAGRRGFEAVGTNFNLRVLTPDKVDLTVAQGEVKVLFAPPQWPDTPAQLRDDTITYGEITVSAHHAALVEPGFQFVSTLEASELDARLAWQRGMIIFDSVALEDALAEAHRYTATSFVLADDTLRNVRVGGYFRTGDVDGLLLALRENFLIDSRRDAQGRVVLSALPKL